MANFDTPSGLLIRFDQEWLSITEAATDHGFFFFFTTNITRSHRGRHWWGAEQRFDEQGRKWMRNIDRLVVDDFGNLVEVPA